MVREIDTLVIHHSASSSGSVEQFTAEHRARGFGTIGYHWLIGNGRGMSDGCLAPGRAESLKGCGVFGNNTGKLHICLVGNFEKDDPAFYRPPSAAQLNALGHWLLIKGKQYSIPWTKVVGHKEIAIPGHETVCPGSLMPLNHTREWYHTVSSAHGLGSAVEPLAEYLERFNLPHCSNSKVQVRVNWKSGEGRYITQTLVNNGKVFIPVDELALVMNWSQPEWDSETRTVSLLTGTR